MKKTNLTITFLIILLNSFLGYGQSDVVSTNISDCLGAIQIEPNVILHPKIPESSGRVNDLKFYSEVLELQESNSLWFKFESSHSGILKLALEKFDFSLEFGIFILEEDKLCADILNGKKELFAHYKMDDIQKELTIDSIQYSKNQIVLLFVNSNYGNKQFAIQANYGVEVNQEEFDSMKEIFDLRKSLIEKPYHFMIRDSKTKLPIVANVIISDSRTFNALYSASDIVFPYLDNLKMSVKINVSGYFFQDVSINLQKDKSDERIVLMEPLEQNQLIELEGLVFQPQTDVLTPDALIKLKRLKDFMIINSDVCIEVQGHVHLDGKNSLNAKRLSKKRAKTVKRALLKSGIDKNRITVVGFGNAKMKYPEAESDAEKQANRRVEIKIK